MSRNINKKTLAEFIEYYLAKEQITCYQNIYDWNREHISRKQVARDMAYEMLEKSDKIIEILETTNVEMTPPWRQS